MTISPQKKAALVMNLFVLPGAGQFYMGRKITGFLWSVATLSLILFLLIHFQRHLLDAIQALPLYERRPEQLLRLLKQTWTTNQNTYWTGLGATVIIWIAASLDLLRKDKEK